MSFATGRSQLQQLNRSTLQQRGAGSDILPGQWWEWITITRRARNTLSFPFTEAQWPALIDPASTEAELAAMPYSILHPDTFNEPLWLLPGFGVSRNMLRQYDPDFAVNPQDGFNLAFQTFLPGVVGASGLSSNGRVRGPLPASAEVYPQLPTYKNPIPPPQPGLYPAQFDRQATIWAWDLSIDTGAASILCFQKARYKWNRTSAGFMIRADIYARKASNDAIGWDPDPGTTVHGLNWGGSGRFSFENVRLYRDYRTTAKDTFIDVPVDFPAQVNPAFRDGFVGRGIFAIDFETPAQWSARTGFRIN